MDQQSFTGHGIGPFLGNLPGLLLDAHDPISKHKIRLK
jgi:hypothetical protein